MPISTRPEVVGRPEDRVGGTQFCESPVQPTRLENFVLKGIEESRKGKLCVFLIPASTDTVLFHDHIQPNATSIEFVRGRLRFEGYNNRGEFCNAPAMKGSMVVVFDGRKTNAMG